MKKVSATFSGNELDAVVNALHEAADAREIRLAWDPTVTPRSVRLDAAVARFYRRIANDVEDAREAADGR